jgi:lysophospholipase L1-like esterase
MRLILAAAAAAAASAAVRVSCVGDSITAGVCASNSSTNYPAVLQRLLGDSYTVGNYGNSGKTMSVRTRALAAWL